MWIEQWTQRPLNPDIAQRLSGQLKLNPVIAKILAIRGIETPVQAEKFLNPSLLDLHEPFLLADMEKALGIFMRALNDDARITVVGDYDVDGVTSSSLLRVFTRELGREIEIVLPNRFTHGYGLTDRILPDVMATKPDLVVTVDCGISSIETIRKLRDEGIDVIVLDHHIPGMELPPASAVVDPVREDSEFPFQGMAAVGVVFYFLIAVRRAMRQAGWFKTMREPALESFLDLVALGTIADSVPLVMENRVFTLKGLEVLSAAARPGIRALKAVAGLKTSIVRAGQVGFILAPRLNAAGRLESAKKALDLLCAEDEVTAVKAAQELNVLNLSRQDTEARILEDAITQVETGRLMEAKGIVVAGEGWHQGVIGIVASRLVDLYHRPSVVISIDGDMARGSVRSVPGFDVTRQALSPLADMLTTFGGHAMAAGLSLSTENLDRFRDAFVELCDRTIDAGLLQPGLKFDAEISLKDVTNRLAEAIQGLGPFGYGNPEPVFAALSVRVSSARIVGKKKDTLIINGEQARGSLKFVGFRWLYDLPTVGTLIDIAFSCDISDYDHRVYGRIRALRSSKN